MEVACKRPAAVYVVQVVAARQVLRGTVEGLIRETREREAAGKASGAGAHGNGGHDSAASAAAKDAAKVRALTDELMG